MKGKDIPVTYVVFPDEGHGFARPVNNIAFNAITENFLASCLGGRAERIGDAVKESTAEVREGAAGVPGLGAALNRTDTVVPPVCVSCSACSTGVTRAGYRRRD